MPRASRRRRRPSGRGLGRPVLIGIAAAATVVLVAGSLLAIHTQSRGYRDTTTRGFAVLAEQVGMASTRTGAQLSTLMAGAPTLTNGQFPYTARGVLEQGLDVAVAATDNQAAQAATITSPVPEDGLANRLTQVMDARESATERLRSTVDRLLGMAPLPRAGAPSSVPSTAPTTLISAAEAASEMAAEGARFQSADTGFRLLQATAAAGRLPVHLHASTWVPATTSPLGSLALRQSAAALVSSAALDAVHHLVLTAVGLSPTAVPTGGAGSASTTCTAPSSTVPGAAPTVVPPTGILAAEATVTDCGNVPESGVIVSVTVAPDAPPGTPLPPPRARGGRSTATVDLASGASTAPTLAALPVASGNRYLVTVSVSVPPGQADATGTTQQFLVQVAA